MGRGVLISTQYGRKYRLQVETWRGDTIEVVTQDSPLHVVFRIEKRIIGAPNWAEITIHNLSRDTETDILQNGKSVTLEAGYLNGAYGVIFKGALRQPIRGKEDGVTFFLKLICIDGDDPLNMAVCNFTMASGQTAQTIAAQVARSSSIPFDIRIDPDLSQQQTQRGKTVFGQPKDVLRNLALNNDAAMYVDNGVVHISKLSKAPPAVVPDLNADTGMLGIPQQVDSGIQVRCLINPKITLDSWFHLNNKDVVQAQLTFGDPQTLLDLDGLYRVVAMDITGDTRGDDWCFDMECVNQLGGVPAMIADDTKAGM